ncbi:MAG TPA: VCBS repeat-containing protein [Candidatus Binatia bacterium]|jgi:bla regulator protein BlaR1|nr:VCBS repeat-containing protein [Candidatus Binatia bacterium]
MEPRKRASTTGAGYTPLNLALLGLLSAALVLFLSPIQAQPVDPTGIVQSFLPQEAQLRTVESADLDGDQTPEIVASYKLPSEQVIIVLQQKDGHWEKVWEQKGPEEFTLSVNVADLTGDGRPELLLDWVTGYMSAGNDLDVYGWRDGTMKKFASIGYHKLEWLPPKQGKSALAVWQKDTGLAFIVKTLRLGKHGWVNVDEQYPEYFREVVVPYDQSLVKQMPGVLAWYYLAEAQVKARLPQEALASIEKGLSINAYYPETYKFEQLKEQALLQLENDR